MQSSSVFTSPRLTSFRTYAVCSQNQYIKPSAQIRTYDSDFFHLLNYHEKKLTLNCVVEILTQSVPEEADETEHERQLFEGRGLFEPGVRMLEGTDYWNEQRTETTRQGILLMFARYEVILKKERYLSRQTSWLGFLK